jgi:small subunit ribosomal protein S16
VAVKIRLMRVGKKKQPTYRVVVADARSPRDGRIIETIGHYGPRQEPSYVDIDADRALEWLRKGAQPTEQAQKLLAVSGVWATFTGERPTPDTKLNRRGHVTGRGPAKNTVKAEKPTPEPKAEPPAPNAGVDAPTAEAEAPAAEAEAPAADETTAEDGEA